MSYTRGSRGPYETDTRYAFFRKRRGVKIIRRYLTRVALRKVRDFLDTDDENTETFTRPDGYIATTT